MVETLIGLLLYEYKPFFVKNGYLNKPTKAQRRILNTLIIMFATINLTIM